MQGCWKQMACRIAALILCTAAITPCARATTIDHSAGFAAHADLTTNGSATFSGSSARLTDGQSGESGSVFANAPVNISRFTTSFNFLLTNAGADGFTFTIQGLGPHALGDAGGGLGYGTGITHSIAIKFDLWDNYDVSPPDPSGNCTGLYMDGQEPFGGQDLTGTGIDLHSGHPFRCDMSYDGTLLYVTITDTVTSASAFHSYTVDIPVHVGGPMAWVGFTGGTGGVTAIQDITAWQFTSGAENSLFANNENLALNQETPNTVVVSDLNGDGLADIVTATNGTVSVLLSKSNGTFQPQTDYLPGFLPEGVAVGDVNGDGKKDIVVVGSSFNGHQGYIGAFLGNGNGTFQPVITSAVGLDTHPSHVVIGDINADGVPDVVYVETPRDAVSWAIGSNNGSFTAGVGQVVYTFGLQPAQVALGDFNNDGLPDLAITLSGSNVVSVVQNKGPSISGYPQFNYPVSYTVGSHPRGVAVGDFDHDGFLDLAVTNFDSNSISVLFNNGSGGFPIRNDYTVGLNPVTIAAGDFNGDGYADLVVGENGGGSATVLTNFASGTFLYDLAYPTDAGPVSAAVGDVNGDGKLDIAIANAGGNDITVLRNEKGHRRATVTGTVMLEDVVDSVQPVTFVFRSKTGQGHLAFSTVLGSDGSFWLAGVPSDTYYIAIKGHKWLQSVIGAKVNGNTSGLSAFLPAGDVVEDNFVDIDDLGALAYSFGTLPTSSRWNDQADLNCDGKVDIDDLVLLANNYGSAGDP